MLACKLKAWDSALLLLRKGANPNLVALQKADALTPLFMAAEKGSLEVCQSLLENGARQDLGGEHLVGYIFYLPLYHITSHKSQQM